MTKTIVRFQIKTIVRERKRLSKQYRVDDDDLFGFLIPFESENGKYFKIRQNLVTSKYEITGILKSYSDKAIMQKALNNYQKAVKLETIYNDIVFLWDSLEEEAIK